MITGRRREYMLKRKRFGRAWKKMSTCLMCEASLPTWKGPLGDVCPACIDRLDEQKYQ